MRQSFSHGRSKTVAVEVKRKRVADAPLTAKETAAPELEATPAPEAVAAAPAAAPAAPPKRTAAPRQLTDEERAARERALRTAATDEAKRPARVAREVAPQEDAEAAAPAAPAPAPEPARPLTAEERRQRELAELRAIEDEEKNKAATAEKARQEEQAKKREAEKKTEADRKKVADRAGDAAAAKVAALGGRAPTAEEEDEERKARARRGLTPTRGAPARPGVRNTNRNRPPGKLTVTQAINSGDGDAFRGRSLAAMRRHAQKGRRDQHQQDDGQKIARDVIIPEAITVQELAQRMAERGSDVIKALMRMGVMATITQSVDADTAELLVSEFGHRSRRVSESDVLIGMTGEEDAENTLISRPPVVTVMGVTSTTARPRCSTPSATPTSCRAKPAASPSISAPTKCRWARARRSPSSIRRVTPPSPKCVRAVPTSPTSSCWWLRPMTVSCRRRSKRFITPRRPAFRSSSRSTRSICPTPIRSA